MGGQSKLKGRPTHPKAPLPLFLYVPDFESVYEHARLKLLLSVLKFKGVRGDFTAPLIVIYPADQ